MSNPIRVFLVDDQAMVRAGFRMLVESQPDLTVVGEAGDGQEALDVLAGTDCDVVLMDVRMPRLDGVAATRELTARPDPPAVVVLTTFDLDEHVFAAIRAGASAFLLKDARPDELLDAVRTVHAGHAVVAPSATKRLLERFADSLPPGPHETDAPAEPAHPQDRRLVGLTEREREVLVLVGRGLSNAEIQAELVVAEATVKTHVGRLLAKTGSRDRVQLVVLAHELRLV
ncbi:response regulator transcription factor [Nocardioides nanhaiensis]|uniref:Response regulator transcription factor n=1 Tax=Nocardioides nanhaiensis TaxID=1476871 RepID=A0ABP8WDT4_9ACTN